MKRLCLLLIAVLFLASGVAFAASKVGMFGVPNSSGTGPMEVDSDRAISVASDATFTTSTADINGGTIDGATVGTSSAAAGKFTTLRATGTATFDGNIVDVALYSKDASTAVIPQVVGVYADGAIYSLAQTMTIGAPTIGNTMAAAGNLAVQGALEIDGALYPNGVIVDLSLYSATSGTGLNRTLCVDSAGRIFSSAAACP